MVKLTPHLTKDGKEAHGLHFRRSRTVLKTHKRTWDTVVLLSFSWTQITEIMCKVSDGSMTLRHLTLRTVGKEKGV